jgi:hypothetical protein
VRAQARRERVQVDLAAVGGHAQDRVWTGMIPGGTRPGEPSAPLRLGGLPQGPRHVPVLLLGTRKNGGTAWRPQAGLTVSTAAPTAPVRGYLLPSVALQARCARTHCGRLQPGTEPRTAYALVSGVRLGERRAVCKTVGSAYVGSNPTPATTCENAPLAANSRANGAFCLCPSMCHLGSL